MRQSRPAFFAALALVLGLGSSAFAQQQAPEADPYVRFAAGGRQEEGALQCAVATFRHPTRNQTVVLYGVVHIADAEYYARVQQDLDSYTTVLYEGVAPGSTEPTEADKSLGDLQKTMGEMLGLTFQKDGIDYHRSNLVHADMNMDELKEKLGGGTINPMGQLLSEEQMKQMAPLLKVFMGFGKMLMKNSPEMQTRMKAQFAQQMAGADMSKLGGQMGERTARVILIDRNEVCMKVLEQQLEKQQDGSIAIFYGAAHMPDLEQRLEAQGFTLGEKRWMSAWQIGRGIDDGWTAPQGGAQAQPAEPVPADGERRWF
jgi:hypothetical protein